MLRVLGNVFLYIGTLLKHVYDLPLFIPLWFEERMSRRTGNDDMLGRVGQ